MNDRAWDVLVQAALSGRPQVTGTYFHGRGACALGVLLEDVGVRSYAQCCNWEEFHAAFGLSHGEVACPSCDRSFFSEMRFVAHLNDDHGFSFLDIARKMGGEETPA